MDETKERIEEARELAGEKLHDIRAWSERLGERVEDFVRERPGTAILAALGAGFLIGKLVRR